MAHLFFYTMNNPLFSLFHLIFLIFLSNNNAYRIVYEFKLPFGKKRKKKKKSKKPAPNQS